MPLSHRDYGALLETILEMHDRAASGSLLDDAPRLIAKLIPCDYCAIFTAELRPPAMLHLTGAWETSPRVTKDVAHRMAHYFPTHPFTGAAQRQKTPSALLFSDFYSMRQLRDQEFYFDFYRLIEIDRQMAIGTATPGGSVSFLSASRGANERDFTERDRLLLTLLRPHFEQARRTSDLVGTPRQMTREQMRSYGLTRREIEVATWMAEGKTNPEIAVILQMRSRTVEKHMEHILLKLAVENRTEAALLIAGGSGHHVGTVRDPTMRANP